MKVIKSVEIMEVDNPAVRFAEFNPLPCYDVLDKAPDAVPIKVIQLSGQRFRDANGHEIMVAWHPKVQDALSMPFQAFEDMNTQLELSRQEAVRQSKRAQSLANRLREFNVKPFWARLRYLLNPNNED